MEIEFDSDKDQINRSKHGVSLTAASAMDFSTALVFPDERRDYGEDRFWAMGEIAGRLHVLAFTMRGDIMRAISLRKATPSERRDYREQGQ